MRNVTITGNASRSYGGVYNPGGGSFITLRNTILAGNSGGQYDPDCAGVLTSAGYNLIGINSSCTGLISSDRVVVSPMLSGLADNGGPTLTHVPFKGSLAIDDGNPAGCAGLSGQTLLTDQRGQPRPFNGRCDIGAVEEETSTPASAKRRVAGHD